MNPEAPGYIPEEIKEEGDSAEKPRPFTRREILKGTAALTGAAALEHQSFKGKREDAEPETGQEAIQNFEADLNAEVLSILGSRKLDDPKERAEVLRLLMPPLMRGIKAIEPVYGEMQKSEQFKRKLGTVKSFALGGSVVGLLADFAASTSFRSPQSSPEEEKNVSRRRFLASLTGAAMGAAGSAAGLASIRRREVEANLQMSATRAALTLISKYRVGGHDPLWRKVQEAVAGTRPFLEKELNLQKAVEQYSAAFYVLDQSQARYKG